MGLFLGMSGCGEAVDACVAYAPIKSQRGSLRLGRYAKLPSINHLKGFAEKRWVRGKTRTAVGQTGGAFLSQISRGQSMGTVFRW